MNKSPIGVYDSGIGGTAVLRTLQKMLPNESYILYADFINAPYGNKTKREIAALADGGVKKLVEMGAKAVVVACNTATSAAIDELRANYSIPIIGMEPAIKPASENVSDGTVLVLATPATLKFVKFQKLYTSLNDEKIVPVACPGLSKLIENEGENSKKVTDYLIDLLSDYKEEKIKAAVIGCTHFSYAEDEIRQATGCNYVFDGRHGTVRQVKKVLGRKGMLSGENGGGAQMYFSGDRDYYEKLLKSFMKRKLSFEE